MTPQNRPTQNSFMNRALELLANCGKKPDWFGGKLAHVAETAINAHYRRSLINELDVRQTPVLLAELNRNKGTISRAKGRELSMDLFFPISLGRALEPREFIPENIEVAAHAAAASVAASGQWLNETRYAKLSCTPWDVKVAFFLLESDRAADLFTAYDAEDRKALTAVIGDVLKYDADKLNQKFSGRPPTVERCLLVVARWIIPLTLWFWTLPKAFQEGMDAYVAREV